MNIRTIRRNFQNRALRDNEDMPVIDLINEINHGQDISLLEVGSGECRFVKKIASLYPNLKITCIEINPQLAQIARDLGFDVINENILNVKLEKVYDIVHCSHVIEHFGFPQITQVLDFLALSTKEKGYLIIRTPLDYEGFYADIDHVRPYPPESIHNYFYLKQQQKQGTAHYSTHRLWYRTRPRQIKHLEPWDLLCTIKPLRGFNNYIIDRINHFNAFLWNRFRMPSSRPTGYVLIARLEKK